MRCDERDFRKARYVFDTLLLAAGVPVRYTSEPPSRGAWLLYAPSRETDLAAASCAAVAYCSRAWRFFEGDADIAVAATEVAGLPVVLPQRLSGFDATSDIDFDVIANAFYFLTSWSERKGIGSNRQRYADSAYARHAIPQDIVDRYLDQLMKCVSTVCQRLQQPCWPALSWPGGATYALVLSHDVDFLPSGSYDVAWQGVKTVARHLIRQQDPLDAWRSAVGCGIALLSKRDPYGCITSIIDREQELGVRSSFAVAVGHRHPKDVNYRIEDERTRDRLRAISDAGFDLCLHGSYRSTERVEWYLEEVLLLTQHLGRPRGSRQHFLSFNYDGLFAAQEEAGIQYDMSMGYPDHPGSRSGFSRPYFPYDLRRDRPYDVLEISLFLMDVTLRGYMGLKGAAAAQVIENCVSTLRSRHGCASVVWHPIVFGGARDPGYDRLYWDMAARVSATGGLATDGKTIDAYWRARASRYPSFSGFSRNLWGKES